jgi:hypothetical protein
MENERQFSDRIFLRFPMLASIGKSAESQGLITKMPQSAPSHCK